MPVESNPLKNPFSVSSVQFQLLDLQKLFSKSTKSPIALRSSINLKEKENRPDSTFYVNILNFLYPPAVKFTKRVQNFGSYGYQ